MIDIDIGSYLISQGSFILSWHGFFSLIAVATAVFLVGRWAPLKGIDPDTIYSIAIWAVIGGIVGARLVHVVDEWNEFYQHNPWQIVAIWQGGIGVWGGILGGFIGGSTYALMAKHPVGIISDLTAPAMLIVQTIGRLGDIVNGEHCAKATDFFLGFMWTNPDSDAQACQWINGTGINVAVHPVIAYEMVWNMISLFVVWKLRGRLKPDGMLFAVYLSLYAIGRFAISFARDDDVWALGMQEAHYISLVVLAITIPLLIVKCRVTAKNVILETVNPVARLRGTRAERRRKK